MRPSQDAECDKGVLELLRRSLLIIYKSLFSNMFVMVMI